MTESKSLSDYNILITGGARGIGRAVAYAFAEWKAGIIINYRESHEEAAVTAKNCEQLGARTLTIAADVSSADEMEKMARTIQFHEMMPDIIINNAGIGYSGLLTDMSEDEWDRIFSVNVKSLFLLSKLFTPHMVRQSFGRIINISSIWGITGASCEVAYSASKGAVHSFTKALAKELAPSRITVNAVAPGATDTAMLHQLNALEKQQLIEQIPAGRLANPQEIASFIRFLALPESEYLNGQIFSPNGAWIT